MSSDLTYGAYRLWGSPPRPHPPPRQSQPLRPYGIDWAQKMLAQQPGFAADQDQALVQIARGEYAIGIGLSGRTAGELLKVNQPIAVVWPEDIGLYTSIGHTIPVGAPHTNAARVFVNWMVINAGQKFWADAGQVPVSASVPPTEEWMKGFAKPRIKKENLATNEALQVLFDKASGAL